MGQGGARVDMTRITLRERERTRGAAERERKLRYVFTRAEGVCVCIYTIRVADQQ